jgi:hypothetical protein
MIMKIAHKMDAGDLIKGQPHLVAAIKEFKGATKQWHQLSHQLIASAVVHAHLTGDIRPIGAIITVMPKGAKTNSMRRYVEKHGPVKWSEVKKAFKFDGLKQRKALLSGESDGTPEGKVIHDASDVEMLSSILNTHWSDMGASETGDNFKPLDFEGRLLRLISDANKALDGENKDKETVKAAEVGALSELYRKLYPNGKAA